MAISVVMRLMKHAPLAVLLLALACRTTAPATPAVTVAPVATPPEATPTATPTPSSPQVVLNGVAFAVELAVTPQERARGLSGRESLGRKSGMLFIFEGDTVPAFWMRGMLIPLDIVWLDATGEVAGVAANLSPAGEGGQPPLYYPPRPIRYVLEINAGLAQELGIAQGSKVVFQGIPVHGSS